MTDKRLNDMERVLKSTIRGLYSTLQRWQSRYRIVPDEDDVHFGSREDELRPGDLVQCLSTREPNPFSFAYFVEWKGADRHLAVLRGIGSQRLCDYGNESFSKVIGLAQEEMWDGARRLFYEKARRVFDEPPADYYACRFGGLRFTEDDSAVITLRPSSIGSHRFNKEHEIWIPAIRKETPPFTWSGRMTYEQIRAPLRSQGWPNPTWEYEDVAVSLEKLRLAKEKRG